MLAASVLNPEKIFQSISGVFPVAISTIIVSPTARPNPIIQAEKIPDAATGITIRTAVCHGVAPAPSEAVRSVIGTAWSASSEIVKIIGITAKPMMIATTKVLRGLNDPNTESRGS